MSKLSVVLIGEKLDLLISNREPGGQEPRQPAPRLDSLTFERSCPAYRHVLRAYRRCLPRWSVVAKRGLQVANRIVILA
jgi:hypothetical protein